MLPVTTTTLGMYNYNPNLFELLELPEGVDKDACIDNILLETCDLELLYPTWQHMHDFIGVWSKVNQNNWSALWKVLNAEYNPIWNKDGTITETESTTGKEETTGSKKGTNTQNTTQDTTGTNTSKTTLAGKTSDSRTIAGTETRDLAGTDSGSNSNSTTHNVAGFDNDTLHASYSDSSSGTNSNNSTDTGTIKNDTTDTNAGTRDDVTDVTGSTTENVTGTLSGATGEETKGTSDTTGNRKYERVEQGNIGVTTTQSMIQEEIELRLQNNFYSYIVDSFKQKFVLGVY